MGDQLARYFHPKKFEELKLEALEAKLYGIPICEMTHDEVLVTLGVLIERLDTLRRDVFGDLRVLGGLPRGRER